ncbi:MAG: ATP-binding protein [Anaerolineae bacterium]
MGRYGAVTDTQKETLEGINYNAKELLTFINNLLDEAQYDTKKLRPVPVEFKPSDWLRESISAVKPLAEQKNLILVYEVADEMPPMLRHDPEWLRKILNNLLSNAIKFTHKGHVAVIVTKVDEKQWMLAVEDSGQGIPTSDLAHIFEAFWQGDGSVTRDANRGVGLGLSIVKRLTRILGGEIVVESVVGKGSTFKVTLPFEVKEKE